MKKLHFDDLGKQRFWKVLLVLSLVLILLGLFKPLELENATIYKYCNRVGFLIQAIFYSRLFWYKNNVQWNKKGFVIRIKPFYGKSVAFEEIKTLAMHENTLTIGRSAGSDLSINLSEIIESDRQKLFQLLKKHVG